MNLEEALEKLKARHGGKLPESFSRLRLGDKVERAAKPIARAIRLSCLDKKTGALRPGSPCEKRKRFLNGEVNPPTSGTS